MSDYCGVYDCTTSGPHKHTVTASQSSIALASGAFLHADGDQLARANQRIAELEAQLQRISTTAQTPKEFLQQCVDELQTKNIELEAKLAEKHSELLSIAINDLPDRDAQIETLTRQSEKDRQTIAELRLLCETTRNEHAKSEAKRRALIAAIMQDCGEDTVGDRTLKRLAELEVELREVRAASQAEVFRLSGQVREAQEAMQQFKYIYPDGFPDDWTPQPEHLASQVIGLCNRQRTGFQDWLTALQENTRLREALQTLVDRLTFVHSDYSYQSVWTINQIHAGPYHGPTYTDAFKQAEAALKTGETE